MKIKEQLLTTEYFDNEATEQESTLLDILYSSYILMKEAKRINDYYNKGGKVSPRQ